MATRTVTSPPLIPPARAALDEHLAASIAGDLDRLAAGYADDARLLTHDDEQVDGRDRIVAWFAERAEFFRTIRPRAERIEATADAAALDWWADSPNGAFAGRDEFDVDPYGRITEQRIVSVGRCTRPPSGVRVELEPPVARLVLDRADKRNAVSQPMLATMTAAVREFAARADLRVVVLRGVGPSFCAGEDVAGFDFPDESVARRFLDGPLTFFEELETLPLPVVVAVHGAALGFGSEVLLVADAVYAEPGALLGFAEIDHGAVPSVLVTRGLGVLSRRRVADLALTGRRVDAGEALELGLVHAVVDDPCAEAEGSAAQIARWDAAATATIQRLVGDGAADDHARARDFMPRVLTDVEVVAP